MRFTEYGTPENDFKKILGNPSTKSKFDNDVWIYIERKQTQSKLKNLGRMKVFKNDVLVLEIDKYGILKKKEFYNKEDIAEMMIKKKLQFLTSGKKKNLQNVGKNISILKFYI